MITTIKEYKILFLSQFLKDGVVPCGEPNILWKDTPLQKRLVGENAVGRPVLCNHIV